MVLETSGSSLDLGVIGCDGSKKNAKNKPCASSRCVESVTLLCYVLDSREDNVKKLAALHLLSLNSNFLYIKPEFSIRMRENLLSKIIPRYAQDP
jgi:hypothetical protein